MTACTVPTCTRPARARGFCSRHYQRWLRVDRPGPRCAVDLCARPVSSGGFCHTHAENVRRHGRPEVRASMVERFWAKVDKHGPVPERRPDLGECWLWTAGRSSAGYGTFNRGGRVYDFAHRVAYGLLVGPITEGLCLDHLCRVRHCVRPTHIEQVTWNENLRRGAAARRLEQAA